MADVHQSPLIILPVKSTEEVDLGGTVKSLIVNSYGEDPSDYSDQTSQLNRSRQDAVRGAGSDATARDLLYKWFHMLEMLELRFPELRVPFPWKDAFTHKVISQSSLAYEKASIIFNIAATLSSLAASQPRMSGNPDGLKRAYTALRQSAGMLSYINENFLHAPSTDMSKDIVKVLVSLMLAQASEVFLEKTIEEKKSNGLISKLASHTAAAYTGLVEDSKDLVNKAIFERAWSPLIQAKAKHFSSVMQYHRALADEAAGSHGVCLIRITLAESLAKEAQRLSVTFGSIANSSANSSKPSLPSDAASSMSSLISTHLAKCTERKETAIKDNDLIYHDILPSESTLPVVDKLVAATAIPIQEIFAAPEVQRVIGADLFQRLVPLAVHESASMYSEEKAKMARAETERHDLGNGELQAALDYMGLPHSLKKYRTIGNTGENGASSFDALADPGSEVMKWSAEETEDDSRGSGGTVGGITSTLDRIASLRNQASNEIEASLLALDEENRECEKQRVRFDHRWTQDPAGLRTKEMRANLKENREALQQASENDRRIQQLWDSIKEDVGLLVSGRDALEATFAAAIAGTTGLYNKEKQDSLIDVGEEEEQANELETKNVQAKLTQMDELLVKLHKIQKDRSEVLADLKEKIQNDDISQLLVLNRRSQNVEPAIFATELEKFKAHQNRIAVSLHHQQAVVAELTQTYKELTMLPAARDASKRWDEKEKARNALIGRLRRAKESHAEVRSAVANGIRFYTDLEEIVKALRKNVTGYLNERKAEREKLVSELEWDEKLKGHGDDRGGTAVVVSPTTTKTSFNPSMDRLHTSFTNLGLGPRSTQEPFSPPPPPPPLPPLPKQQQQFRQSSYAPMIPLSSPQPLLQPSGNNIVSTVPPTSPYETMFDSGPFADTKPPPLSTTSFSHSKSPISPTGFGSSSYPFFSTPLPSSSSPSTLYQSNQSFQNSSVQLPYPPPPPSVTQFQHPSSHFNYPPPHHHQPFFSSSTSSTYPQPQPNQSVSDSYLQNNRTNYHSSPYPPPPPPPHSSSSSPYPPPPPSHHHSSVSSPYLPPPPPPHHSSFSSTAPSYSHQQQQQQQHPASTPSYLPPPPPPPHSWSGNPFP